MILLFVKRQNWISCALIDLSVNAYFFFFGILVSTDCVNEYCFFLRADVLKLQKKSSPRGTPFIYSFWYLFLLTDMSILDINVMLKINCTIDILQTTQPVYRSGTESLITSATTNHNQSIMKARTSQCSNSNETDAYIRKKKELALTRKTTY